MLPFPFVNQNQVLLQPSSDDPIVFYTAETKVEILLEVQRTYPDLKVRLEKVQPEQLQEKAEYLYGTESNQINLDLISTEDFSLSKIVNELPAAEDLLDQENNSPIIRLINGLFAEALKRKASDIHIETYEETVSVRVRQDGVLQEVLTPDRRLAPLLVSRIKVMAKLDIAEKRVPQDGRITVRIANRPIDVRVSTLPTSYGERIVMRILDQRSVQLDLEKLGMPKPLEERFRSLLLQPNGIILVTGPTGSGKTTSLYTGLTLLNEKSRNILTVEDPVEYALEGIGQTQVNSKQGMTFAKGLKAILRQDPDVVMVGEIRDKETAEIAVQASLTGHLVLSTLHTNDAASAITRLIDIGVEPYLVVSSLRAVLAQRLVRKLCCLCREEVIYQPEELHRAGIGSEVPVHGYMAVGCESCNYSGYEGRQGIYELLPITKENQSSILGELPEAQLREDLSRKGMTLSVQALALVESGVTDLKEVLRTVRAV